MTDFSVEGTNSSSNMGINYWDSFKKSIDSVIIYSELISPRLYTLVISFMLLFSILSLGYIFDAPEIVMTVLLLGWLVIALILQVIADMVIVLLSRDCINNKTLNVGLCLEISFQDMKKYLGVLIPINLIKYSLLTVLISVLFSQKLLLDLTSFTVNLVFDIGFLFLIQITLLETFGIFRTIQQNLTFAKNNLLEILKYIIFRWVMVTFASFLILLLCVLIFFAGVMPLLSPTVQITETLLFDTFINGGIFAWAAGLIAIIIFFGLTVVLSSIILYMDTDVYLELIRQSPKARKTRPKKRKKR